MSAIKDITAWRKLWDLLSPRDRRNAAKVLVLGIISAGASTFMVGSIMPFLSVLSDPSVIHSVPELTWTYQYLEFTSEMAFLIALGLASLSVIIIAMAIQLLRIYAVARFGMMRVHSFSSRLLTSYLGQPYEYFLNHHSGDLGTRVLSEAQEAVLNFLRPTMEMVTALFTIIALIGFLLWINPLLTLATLATLCVIYATTYGLTRLRLKRLGNQRADQNANRFRIATEAFGGIKDLKLLGREAAYIDRFNSPSYLMADAMAQVQILAQAPFHIIQTVAMAGVIIVCLALIDPVAFSNRSALPEILPLLGVFAFTGQRLMPELGRLYRNAAVIRFGSAAIDKIYEDLMALRHRDPLPRSQPPSLGLHEKLQLENLSYHYPSARGAGVSDLNLEVRATEKIGIVGGTGAGKTTLADLILGLLHPKSGNLIADGTPVTDQNRRAWQQTVGYVPQDIFLTDGKISENIALGVPPEEIDMNRVRQAATAARIDAFVCEDLPLGYDTIVGERGVRLSGGQRQRIGIARALYQQADLIVFDEATSALDNLTESEVMEAIRTLPGNKTVLMIAHRLSTVRNCDRIIVMEHGRVAGFDTWDALMANNAAFQHIAKIGETA